MTYTTQTIYATKLSAADAKYKAMEQRVDEQIAELQVAFDRLDKIIERNNFGRVDKIIASPNIVVKD